MTKTQANTIKARIQSYQLALRSETNPAARKCIEDQIAVWAKALGW